MYIIYIILYTFNPHNVKKNPREEGKKTCVLKKKFKKKPPQLDTDVRLRAVKKKTVKKSTRVNNYWQSIKSNA
jgi:hypothetical protein